MNAPLIKQLLLISILSVCLSIPLITQAAGMPPYIDGQPLPSLAPMLEHATPAVVNISTSTNIQVSENPLMQDPFFRQFFNVPNQSRQRQNNSLGSGVIIDSNQGLVLTNNHVIDKADKIRVNPTAYCRFQSIKSRGFRGCYW
jgi:serine protease Do/serine protease DegQ